MAKNFDGIPFLYTVNPGHWSHRTFEVRVCSHYDRRGLLRTNTQVHNADGTGKWQQVNWTWNTPAGIKVYEAKYDERVVFGREPDYNNAPVPPLAPCPMF